jgi:hypothetical protein
MGVSDNEVVAGLTYGGIAISDWFLIDGAVCLVNSRGEVMISAIDDEALAAATVTYLRRIGAPEYPSFQAYDERGQV